MDFFIESHNSICFSTSPFDENYAAELELYAKGEDDPYYVYAEASTETESRLIFISRESRLKKIMKAVQDPDTDTTVEAMERFDSKDKAQYSKYWPFYKIVNRMLDEMTEIYTLK